jgi:hypothetical protein
LLSTYVNSFNDVLYDIYSSSVQSYADSVAMVRVHTITYMLCMSLSFPRRANALYQACKFMVYDSPHMQAKNLGDITAKFNSCLFKCAGVPITIYKMTPEKEYGGYSNGVSVFDPVEYEYTRPEFEEGVTELEEIGLNLFADLAVYLRDAPTTRGNMRDRNALYCVQFSSGYTRTDNLTSFIRQIYGKDDLAFKVVEDYGFDYQTRVDKNREWMTEYVSAIDDPKHKVFQYFIQESGFEDKDDILDWIGQNFVNEHWFPYTLPEGINTDLDKVVASIGNETEQILKELTKHENLIMDKGKIAKNIFDIQTSGSSGGFRGSFHMNTPYKSINILPLRKKNIFTLFCFEDLISMRDELVNAVINIETSIRTVPGGKRTRAIMIDAIIHYIIAFCIRDGMDYVMKNNFSYRKGSGNLLIDFIQQLRDSTNYDYVELDVDYSTFDGSVKAYLKAGMRDAIESIMNRYLYDAERRMGDLLLASKYTKYRQPMVLKDSNGNLNLILVDMIESGDAFTSIDGSIVNQGILEYVSSVLAMKKISIDASRVQGDDSASSVKLKGVSVENDVLVYDEEQYNVDTYDTIVQTMFDVAQNIGMETNQKGGIGSNVAEYLQVLSCDGKFIRRPRLQFLCTEGDSNINVVDEVKSLIGLERLGMERGYETEWLQRYILLFYLVRFMWRGSNDIFYQLPLSSICTPNGYGGAGYIWNMKSLHAFPNYDIKIQYEASLNPKFGQRLRKYAYILTQRDEQIIGVIAEAMFEGDGYVDVQDNWMGYRLSLPSDISDYVIEESRRERAVQARNVASYKVPKGVYYPDKVLNYIRRSIQSLSEISKAKRLHDQIDKDIIINTMASPEEIPLPYIDKVLQSFSIEVAQVREIYSFKRFGSNPFEIADRSISDWYYMSNIATVDNIRAFDGRNVIRLIQRADPGFDRSVDSDTIVRVLCQPEVLYNDDEFRLALAQMGIEPNVAGPLQDELRRNALLYILVTDDWGYSTIADGLGVFDLSQAFIRSLYDETKVPDRVIKSIIEAYIMMDLQTYIGQDLVPVWYDLHVNVTKMTRFSTRYSAGVL